ncbi:UbiA family prenyltransferase [Ekhidna sp.]
MSLQYTFKTLSAITYTIRPSATLGTCLLTFAAFNPQEGEWNQAWLLVVSMFFGSAFCFMINDIYDREKDLLNKKSRPIATGVISMPTAVKVTVIFACLLLVFSWFLGIHVFSLAIAFLLGTGIYSFINARTGLLANSIVALIAAGTQWGILVLKPDHYLWASSVFLFFFTVPREVLLDWLDIDGDRAWGKRSFPMYYSLPKVKVLVGFCLLIATSALLLLLEKRSFDLSAIFFAIGIVSLWASFFPFFQNASNKTALLSVRISHVTYAFLILALLSR